MRCAPTHQARAAAPRVLTTTPSTCVSHCGSEMRACEQAGGGLARGHRWVGGRDTHFTATPPALRSTERQEEKKGRLPSINTGLFTSSGPFACNSNCEQQMRASADSALAEECRVESAPSQQQACRGSNQKRQGPGSRQMRKLPDPAAVTSSPLPAKLGRRFSSSTPPEGYFLP